jgi:hypothetical protein
MDSYLGEIVLVAFSYAPNGCSNAKDSICRLHRTVPFFRCSGRPMAAMECRRFDFRQLLLLPA